MAPLENLTKAADMKKIREVDFVQRFTHSSLAKLIEVLGVTRKIPMMEGTTMYVYTMSGELANNGEVGEGEIIPLTKIEQTKTPVGEITLKKWRKGVSAEAIKKSGYQTAVIETDEKLLSLVQNGVRSDLFGFLNGVISGSASVVGAGLQEALANAWGELQALFEDDTAQAVYFVNPKDIAGYLGKASITTQTVFGMTYIEDFLGLGTVIISNRITKGTFLATAKENIIMYYLTMNGDLANAFGLTADELGYIGIKSGYTNEERAQIESLVMDGIQFLVEYAGGVVKGEIDDSFLTDLTVAADAADQTFPWTDKTPGDFQDDVSVVGGKITGTLTFMEGGLSPSGPLAGDGHFLALKFDNFASGLTYANVKVGLVPSASGMDLVTLDSDKDCVFKITDKNNQVLKVVQEDSAGHKNIQLFSLKGLTLESPGV